jgi:hypothetical protein
MFAPFDSGFSSTDSGCGSCSTIDDAFNVTTPMSTSPLNNPHAVQQQASLAYQASSVMANHANSVMPGSAPMHQVARPAMQNVATMVPTQQVVQVANNTGMVPQQQQATTTTGQAAMNKMVATAVGAKPTVEGFQAGGQVQVNIPGRLIIINIGFIILAALATNEAVKYYLNKALQAADCSLQHYYLIYSVIAIIVVVGVHWYTKTYMAA